MPEYGSRNECLSVRREWGPERVSQLTVFLFTKAVQIPSRRLGKQPSDSATSRTKEWRVLIGFLCVFFSMCVCACVCALCMYVSLCECLCVCVFMCTVYVCVWVCICACLCICVHTHIYIYIHIYICLCVSALVCVCM